jgi:threonine aldolase
MLGGTMRQSGMLAGACLYSLEHHRSRLVDDHRNARRLAEAISNLPGITLDPAMVETNIVYFDITGDAMEYAERLSAAGVSMLDVGPHTMRAVTNLMVDEAGIDRAVEAVANAGTA